MTIDEMALQAGFGGYCWLENLQQIEDRTWIAEAPAGWVRAARELSSRVGGQVWPRRAGMTWVCGRNVSYFLTAEDYQDSLSARKVCQDLGVNPGRTVGACARALLIWVTQQSEPYSALACDELTLDSWGYHDCRPGVYRCAELFDVQSAYYSLVCRLPSPRVIVGRRSICWIWQEKEEKARWRALLSAVADTKQLRNTLVGAMRGRLNPEQVFVGGRGKTGRRLPGVFPAAAALVVRSCWELCREAAEDVDSVYSCVDSVVTTMDARPGAWERAGLIVRRKAAGIAEICHYGSYCIGERETEFYAAGHREPTPVERPVAPERLYYQEWMV